MARGGLPPRTQAALARISQGFMPRTLTIQRASVTLNTDREPVEAWTAVTTPMDLRDLPCRIVAPTSDAQGAQRTPTQTTLTHEREATLAPDAYSPIRALFRADAPIRAVLDDGLVCRVVDVTQGDIYGILTVLKLERITT
jgi:hypothetical protein